MKNNTRQKIAKKQGPNLKDKKMENGEIEKHF